MDQRYLYMIWNLETTSEIQENSWKHRQSQVFLNRTISTQEIRTKIDKWDCIKLKTCYISKETITRMKRQSTEWEKICSVYKGLVFRIYKEHKKIKHQKNKDSS
jgi:hypothetical protein